MTTRDLALIIDYKLFHRQHFYPDNDSVEDIQAMLEEYMPQRDNRGHFTKINLLDRPTNKTGAEK